jgi:hypothetical protein
MKRLVYLLTAGTILLSSCSKDDGPPSEVIGYAPMYQTDQLIKEIKSIDPQPIINGGKIYVLNNNLYQVEADKGIHVLDIHYPEHPVKLAFIQIAGAQELSIKGGLLYSNNYNDLVVIDIANINKIKVVKRMENVFHLMGKSVPPEKGYFECIDPDKGSIIGWQKKMLYSPKCKY